jgi:hypothetical protein
MSRRVRNILFCVGESSCYSLMFINLLRLFYVLVFGSYCLLFTDEVYRVTSQPNAVFLSNSRRNQTTVKHDHLYVAFSIWSTYIHTYKCVIQYTESRARIRDIPGWHLGPERVTEIFRVFPQWLMANSGMEAHDHFSPHPVQFVFRIILQFDAIQSEVLTASLCKP